MICVLALLYLGGGFGLMVLVLILQHIHVFGQGLKLEGAGTAASGLVGISLNQNICH